MTQQGQVKTFTRLLAITEMGVTSCDDDTEAAMTECVAKHAGS